MNGNKTDDVEVEFQEGVRLLKESVMSSNRMGNFTEEFKDNHNADHPQKSGSASGADHKTDDFEVEFQEAVNILKEAAARQQIPWYKRFTR